MRTNHETKVFQLPAPSRASDAGSKKERPEIITKEEMAGRLRPDVPPEKGIQCALRHTVHGAK